MIDLHLHNLHIQSSQDTVHVESTGPQARSLTIPAGTLPDLAALLSGTRPEFTFDPLELTVAVCGVTLRKQAGMAEVLAAILRAARFASGASLEAVLEDAEHWKTQVKQVQFDLQERHLRARLARLMGVQQEALLGFRVGEPQLTRSGLTTVLQGRLMGAEMVFTLEFEHLLLYADTQGARKVTRLSDLSRAAEAARDHGILSGTQHDQASPVVV